MYHQIKSIFKLVSVMMVCITIFRSESIILLHMTVMIYIIGLVISIIDVDNGSRIKKDKILASKIVVNTSKVIIAVTIVFPFIGIANFIERIFSQYIFIAVSLKIVYCFISITVFIYSLRFYSQVSYAEKGAVTDIVSTLQQDIDDSVEKETTGKINKFYAKRDKATNSPVAHRRHMKQKKRKKR